MNSIKRQNEIAAAIKKAQKFFKENGFIDFTRFSSFFPKRLWKNDESRVHFLVNCYNMLFYK